MSLFDGFWKKSGKSSADSRENPLERVHHIEDLKARNLLDLRELEDRAEVVERKIRQEEEALNNEGISKAEEDRHARRIVLLEAELKSLRDRTALYFDNASLHLNIISDVQEMDAMRALGVSEGQLDSLAEQRKTEASLDARVRLARDDMARVVESRSVNEQDKVLDAVRKRYKHRDTDRARDTEQQGRDGVELESEEL